jgi:ribosome biogenesis GTPase
MTLEDLGYPPDHEQYRIDNHLNSFDIGRVSSEHKERYTVITADKEYDAEIIGKLRFSSRQRSHFPAVGDWVAITPYDETKVLIHALFPRKNTLERQAVGKQGEKQIIAANIDFAFIVQAVDRDFNINRMERYLTICQGSGVEPVIILNKIDLIGDTELQSLVAEVRTRIPAVPVLSISNETRVGIDELKKHITPGKTYCLLGSSGVGKSTLINLLSGKSMMRTGAISSSTSKGRHVTSHRELQVLEQGGILIDNPGMREVGIADAEGGLESTFEHIILLSGNCKFKNCTHTGESGCAVLSALAEGEIDEASYENYLRMEREKSHFESTVAERRKRDKEFGKMVKHIKKDLKLRKQ